MSEEIRLCPFRKDEKGQFERCYRTSCMAYLEYDQPVINMTAQSSLTPPPVHVTLCRMMAQPMYYGGGCNC